MLESNVDLFSALDRIAASRSDDALAAFDHVHEEELRALENHIAAVVTANHRRRLSGIACPVCETEMLVCADHGLPEFGDLDVSLREMSCPTCGMLANRIYHPSVGYDAKIIR